MKLGNVGMLSFAQHDTNYLGELQYYLLINLYSLILSYVSYVSFNKKCRAPMMMPGKCYMSCVEDYST